MIRLLYKLSALSIMVTAVALAKPFAHDIKNVGEFRDIMSQKKPAIILFYTPWCNACKSMKEPFNTIAGTFDKQVTVIKVNADNEKLKEVVDAFNIEAIPTIIIKTVGTATTEQLTKSLTHLVGKPHPAKKDVPKKSKPVTKKDVQKKNVGLKRASK